MAFSLRNNIFSFAVRFVMKYYICSFVVFSKRNENNCIMLPHPDATGLAPNEKRPLILQISPVSNLTWPIEDRNISYFIPSGEKIIVKLVFVKLTNFVF